MSLFTDEAALVHGRDRMPALRLRKPAIDVEQGELLRPALQDCVPSDSPARWILSAAMQLDLSGLLVPSQGGANYDPRRLLAVWFLAIHDRLSSSRQIERFCRSDAQYLWLMGGLVPDHVTLCRLRRSLGPLMPSLLAQTVSLAQEAGLVPLRLAALDGTRLPGNITQWKKALSRVRVEDEPPEGPSDPSARVMRTANGFVKGYNAQAMVDADTRICVAGYVTNEPVDQNQLSPALENCRANCGRLPDELCADAGFSSMANSSELDKRGVRGYIPQHHSTPWETGEDGEPGCPCGHSETRQRRTRRAGKPVISYTCGGCGSRLRVPQGVHLESWLGAKERSESVQAAWVRAVRKTTIEPLFALVKERYGLRRFTLRGIQGAQTQFLLVLTLRNLTIMARQGLWTEA